MFLTEEEHALSEEYLRKGYVIGLVADREGLDWIRDQFVLFTKQELKIENDRDPDDWLDQIHEYVPISQLNDFRMKMISDINGEPRFREHYFRLARPYLETLVGNELAMQLRVNLSIQLPQDDSSLLPVHADTWSGDSPFEIVVWIPLVDCYGTKSMYLLSPDQSQGLDQNFSLQAGDSSETLYQSIASKVQWLEVKYGEVLVFDQRLPHGNRVNMETGTRWSMNCRFKGVFTPYGDKKLGEFFEPITLRASSRSGMAYRYPEVS